MSFFKSAKPVAPAANKLARPASSTSASALFDPLPLPEVVESDSDTSWAMWEDSVQSQNPELDARGDQDTVPMALLDESQDKKPAR